MKKKFVIACLILGLTFFVGRYAYVSSYGIHLTSERFIELAGDRDDAGSMYSLSYDGVRGGRVYLSSWKMDQVPRTILYWTEIDGLPFDTKNEILGGAGRWKVAGHANNRNVK